ncbi:hypothetical protein PRNP1_006078 [Phytophthora ramorum]
MAGNHMVKSRSNTTSSGMNVHLRKARVAWSGSLLSVERFFPGARALGMVAMSDVELCKRRLFLAKGNLENDTCVAGILLSIRRSLLSQPKFGLRVCHQISRLCIEGPDLFRWMIAYSHQMGRGSGYWHGGA